MVGRRRRVVWTTEAQSTLEEALSYIAHESPQGARSVLRQLLEGSASLATMSERGRVVPEQDNSSIREIFVGRFRLLYEVQPSEVRILSFLHGARDFEQWRRDD
ncbi:MAG: type II toxin-antitoxin system RelE/ParE family toxin [bacterium]|nr:type II toxin-antitoxin system RelE/ParE family toxin [bacterium]